MHTMRGMGQASSLRFLPWHRDYLTKAEEVFRSYGATAGIPYWDGTVSRGI